MKSEKKTDDQQAIDAKIQQYQKSFDEILNAVLARVSIVLNFDILSETIDSALLVKALRSYNSKDVVEILRPFDDQHLYHYNRHTNANALPRTYLQENYFYPQFNIIPDGKFKKIGVLMTESFTRDAILGLDETDPFFIENNINYFTKYMWHTYTHNGLQDINHNNYKDFKGEAREDSDYVADSIATYMLLTSYGIPMIGCNHDRIVAEHSEVVKDRMIFILKNNRCNAVFRKREDERPEDSGNDDIEFRFKRNLLNYLAGFILAEGLALEDVKIYLGPSKKIIVRINGKFISTSESPATTKDNKIVSPSRNDNKALFVRLANHITVLMRQQRAAADPHSRVKIDKEASDYISNIIYKTTRSEKINESLRDERNRIHNNGDLGFYLKMNSRVA